MPFEPNQLYHGFRLQEETYLPELDSTARIWQHERSGAALVSLSNDDPDKLFSISFRTPPDDRTGVAHILEHSVLCGSESFPSKEPFVELLKGSLQTFLNAMTFGDKTMYPVGSTHPKDLFNLMHVYMDSVFKPNIYRKPDIFKQEGWHYELTAPDAELTYNGVVYNEMKGVYSSPDAVHTRHIRQTLFPDNAYGHDSGGDPSFIPDLTYEQFLAFHSKYYHPSNSCLFLYGDVDIDEALAFLNDRYLSGYERQDVDGRIREQAPFHEVTERTFTCPGDTAEGRSQLSLSFAAGESSDRELYIALEILKTILLDTPSAPLKKALTDAKIGSAVVGYLDTGLLQPVFSVIVKNTDEARKEQFRSLVYETLTRLAENGLDAETVEAAVNKYEFALREADFGGYPKSLVYNMIMLDSWLYGGHPLRHLAYEETLEAIKSKAAQGGYFEGLIRRLLLDNPHAALILLKPEKDWSAKLAEQAKERLAAHKATLSEQELEELVRETSRLKAAQAQPDDPAALAAIPSLTLADLDPHSQPFPTANRTEQGVEVLHLDRFTQRIAYMTAVFDLEGLPEALLPYVKLLTIALGKIGTAERSEEALSNQINLHTGGISFSLQSYGDAHQPEQFRAAFQVNAKAFYDKTDRAAELIREILGSSRLTDGKRLKEIVSETKTRTESVISSSGHIVSRMRALSHLAPRYRFDELTGGLQFYRFLCELESGWDARWDDTQTALAEVCRLLFTESRFSLAVACEEEAYSDVTQSLMTIRGALSAEEPAAAPFPFQRTPVNEGFATAGSVQYVTKAGNFREAGYSYSGELQVLRTILNLDYLWNKVRVLGGAYGVSLMLQRDGTLTASSYRDPKLAETLAAYDGMPGYLEAFEAEEREMTKYIIGTISRLDTPLTPQSMLSVALGRKWSGLTQEDVDRERADVLGATAQAMRGYSPLITAGLSNGCVCVVGGRSSIAGTDGLFDTVEDAT
ncbi:peptidase [Paenibacillus sp. J31TS4]|uniref:insulinase family protein n=1 Tax=Paenibacillus sp. J31TS4 TaxID=2807195 RepID=UPI001B2257C1|nr:insulinase family protein [Paenibacillus sp. J31TS4]GIP39509.1 peptidase [Paenibacillus sp. J31TS4]